jgi:glycerol-3-phosphate acyltransferase PlsY
MATVFLIILAYLLGAIPFGVIVGKLWKGIDITKVGSGNIGATNTYRVLGPGPGATVFVLDIVKGYLPVHLARSLMPHAPWMAVVVSMVAIIGHTFSVFLKFKGGKGVATSLGAIIGLDARVAAIGFGVWVLLVAVTRYVSVASIAASASVPILMIVFHEHRSYILFGILAGAFVIWKHRSNMDRLLHGTERRWGQGSG